MGMCMAKVVITINFFSRFNKKAKGGSMNIYFGMLVVGLCGVTAYANERRHHDSHEHGVAELNIAIESNTIELELHSPAESIVGFEHTAKTAAEKKLQADSLAIWKTRAAEIITIDPSFGCKLTKAEAEVDAMDDHAAKPVDPKKKHDADHHHASKHGSKEQHSEVDADATITCTKPVVGTKISIDPTKLYPKIKKLKVQVVGAKQTGGSFSKFPASIDL